MRMSALGHKLPLQLTVVVSALPPKADINYWLFSAERKFPCSSQKISLQHV